MISPIALILAGVSNAVVIKPGMLCTCSAVPLGRTGQPVGHGHFALRDPCRLLESPARHELTVLPSVWFRTVVFAGPPRPHCVHGLARFTLVAGSIKLARYNLRVLFIRFLRASKHSDDQGRSKVRNERVRQDRYKIPFGGWAANRVSSTLNIASVASHSVHSE